MNPFEAYAKKANTIVTQRPRLVGPTKTRKDALVRYTEIVGDIAACEDRDALDCLLISLRRDIAQFRAELEYLWDGDGADFIGLSGEIGRKYDEFREAEQLCGCEAGRSFGR